MKRIVCLLLMMVLAFNLPFSTAGADKPTAAETNDQVVKMAAELEKKYSIDIKYPKNKDGFAVITTGNLTTLDQALENLTPAAIREISDYYKQKNGKRITVSYVRDTTKLNRVDATLAVFYKEKSLIEYYLPTSTTPVGMTGDSPISIVHEFAHALHFMHADRYGAEKMKREWLAFNGGSEYKSVYLKSNPDTRKYVSGYAATMYEEDVAETIAHALVRNRSGQGFKSKLTQGGNATALGKKVAYIEKLLAAALKNSDAVLENYRKIYQTAVSVKYKKLVLSGDYLQFAGYPQPRNVLKAILSELQVTQERAVWIRQVGGWYVELKGGDRILVFPGGTWSKLKADFPVPEAA